MTQFDIALNIRDLEGNLVKALEDAANGLWVRRGGMPTGERGTDESWVTSPWVNGAGLQGSTVPMNDETLLVKVFGPDWVTVETRYEALKAALTARAWLLEESIQGVSRTWRAGPVRVIPVAVDTTDILNNRRFVTLGFKTQPTPTIAGL